MKCAKKAAFLLVATATFFTAIKSYAYTISFRIDIDPTSVEEGHIISYDGSLYKLTEVSYDPRIFGVVVKQPDIAIFEKGEEAQVHVANIGETLVKVSGVNGNIKTGDFITSSDISGVGMKAKGSGNILGTALEDFIPENKKEEGMILVAVGIKEIEQHSRISRVISRILNKSDSDSVSDPFNLLRYFISALIVAISFTWGLKTVYQSLLSKASQLASEGNVSNLASFKNIDRVSFLKSIFFISIGLFFAYIILVI